MSKRIHRRTWELLPWALLFGNLLLSRTLLQHALSHAGPVKDAPSTLPAAPVAEQNTPRPMDAQRGSALKTAQSGPDMDVFLAALWQQESSGQLNPRPGDGGDSHGPFQIQAGYWQDATERMGVKWAYPAGAYDLDKAKAVVRAYIKRYQGNYPISYETWAKLHCGGPDGPEQDCTEAYWGRFTENLR